MNFQMNEAEVRELAQIEAEAGCDVRAGCDWSTRPSEVLGVSRYVDHQKLMAVLNEGLVNWLSEDEVAAIADELQVRLSQLVVERQQSNQ